jgi:two-component system, NtrC family, sensor kinase
MSSLPEKNLRELVESADPGVTEHAAFQGLLDHLEGLEAENARLEKRLKASQAQLVQSGKMAAVGQLAAGVAHEVNNPLQIILSRVQLLMIRHQEKDGLVKDLRLIESNVKRISRIIRSLLDFARHNSGEEEYKEVDLAYLVNQTLNLMHHLLEKGKVEAHLHVNSDLPSKIAGNTGEMEQVFLNLIINALQAMQDDGGSLEINLDHKDDQIIVTLQDTGEGIPEQNLPRIFDPFFTTREDSGGTGLGLSIIYGIVEKHSGRIEVDSEIGHGTTFTLKFPAIQDTV